MIIGTNKDKVIENIRLNTINNELNKKVEVDDPNLSEEVLKELLDNFYKIRKNKILFSINKFKTNIIINTFAKKINNYIEIKGLNNLKHINNGAIITSNHFNPLDSLIIKKLVKTRYKKDFYIVSQDTNLALPGMLGKLVNYQNVIPIAKSPSYIIDTFKPYLKKVIDKKNYVLIYPEEEMWFNYRLPRPCKRGAYQFAAELNVPIISCFTEIIDLGIEDNEQFNQVKYVLHILKPIYPDKNKSVRQNSIDMAKLDYEQKIKAYEKAYKTKLDYTFSYNDIAGLKKKD